MSTVRYLAPDTDAYVDFIVQNKSEFEQQSGLTLETHIIPTDEYYSNQIGKYLDAEEPPDVFMSGPVLLWEHLGKNRVQPLDDFVANASDEFDFDDFYPRLIQSNRWSTMFGDRLGHGPLWEIPVNWESYNLVYHPVALERARSPARPPCRSPRSSSKGSRRPVRPIGQISAGMSLRWISPRESTDSWWIRITTSRILRTSTPPGWRGTPATHCLPPTVTGTENQTCGRGLWR